jgi:hypothetical protein
MTGSGIRCTFAALLIGLCLVLVGQSPLRAEPKPPVDPDLAKSDAKLLEDDGKATGEFQRRLRAQVAYRNGLLVIQDHSGGSSGVVVMPATVMWSVDCSDSGLTVTFGSGSGDTENGVDVQLTAAAVPVDKCQRIAPAIGDAVLALTKGN